MIKFFKLFLLCTLTAFALGLAACADSPQHEHDWEWVYDQSIHWQECDGCDLTQGSGEHSFTDGVCSVCGYTDPNYSSHTHTYGEWQIFAPGYVDEGSAIKICTTCEVGVEGHSVEIILPTLDDSRYEKIVENGACIDSGLVIYSITIDGESLTFSIQYINAGHKLQYHPATVTCTENGNSKYWECSVCGRYFSDLDANTEIKEGEWIVTAKGHSLEKHESIAPTCTESGNMEYFDCSVCSKYFYELDGELVETALNDIILPAEGHELQEHAGVPVDCETPGIRDYWECMVCRKYFSDGNGNAEIDLSEIIIPATGHPFNEHWTTYRYFGHFRYSTCKHQKFEEKPHEYEGGVCKVCGYKEPKVYFDEDAPDGQTGYIIIYENGEIYADVYIPYLLGQTDPEIPFTTFYPESFFETGYDEQYGISWQTQIYVNRTYYILNFYCDFENGSTFKIHSLAQRYEFAQVVDGSNYLVYLYQNILQTPFCKINQLTNMALYQTKADGTGKEYIAATRTEYHIEEDCIYWYCAPKEGQTIERIFRVDITFDENGILSSATLSHVHTYGEWEITADYHAHYPTCEHNFEIVIGDHEYTDGVCKVCGFKEPKVFTDEDGTGATISTFEISGEKIVRFNLKHIKDEGGLPFQNEKAAEDVVQIGGDPVYGGLWQTTIVRFSGASGRPIRPEVEFRIQFYWNIEGGTFKLYSVGRYKELFTSEDADGKKFGVALYQSYYQTSFGFEEFSLLDLGLYLETEAGAGQYNYIIPTDLTFADDGSILYTAVDQIDGRQVEVCYLIEITYGSNGFASSVFVTKEA